MCFDFERVQGREVVRDSKMTQLGELKRIAESCAFDAKAAATDGGK
jgi:hypothetical protein